MISTDQQNSVPLSSYFAAPGDDPYSALQWELRDAVITSVAGEEVFRQEGVEFPAFWSQTATNIVASKYFRQVGGVRESSVQSMVNRVAETLAMWGEKDGYFTAAGGETFYQELSSILLGQFASFNSPVWFNVGVPGSSNQASACFLLSVEDSMESITQWYRDESVIFKGGSGAGVNVSALRAENELLSLGGRASGPLSWMKVADASAGAIKSGGTTRRAAKLVCMDADHPDILKFIWAKVHEETKARVLMAAGYSDAIDGEALGSVAYQNANHSVRLSGGFMEAVEAGESWHTSWRTNGQITTSWAARELLAQLAQAAWTSGDPGVMFSDTTSRWHTCPMSGPITTSNPCGEFVFLNNTACNLASINLLKFLRDDGGSFDTEGFCHTVDIMLLAQEILVSNSSYPTPQIACMSEHYRPLGLGFANLGALLMAKGLPYDSVQGRDLAAAVTALMTGRAYQQSAEMARVRGAFTGYAPNRDAMLGVIDQHIDALKTGYESQPDVFPVWQAAGVMWDRARELGRAYGFRNAQVTLLAPTGTISFMMDCTTTGVEPDVALVNYKKLVGGGTLKHVNDQVPRALESLGYSPGADSAFGPSIAAIVKAVTAGKDLEEAGVASGHLAVFDCAFPSKPGGRSIAWQGHVRMVAALQPFLSGAISKTINLPTDATVQDVQDAFMLAWKLGCKAIAVYRDGCKHTQVLTTTAEAAQVAQKEAVAMSLGKTLPTPKRRRLPDERQAFTHKFCVGGVHEGYLTVGLYDDGTPGEIFLKMAKEGSTLSGFADGFAVMVSVALQYGVPLHTLVEKFSYTHFEPAGWTSHTDIKYANSILDYVFRYLAGKFLPPANPVPDPTQDVSAPVAAVEVPRIDLNGGGSVAGSVCWICGSWLLRNGSCLVCPRCGANTGCSG